MKARGEHLEMPQPMPVEPTWLEALYDAVVTRDGETLSVLERTTGEIEDFASVRRCLELLEKVRRSHSSPSIAEARPVDAAASVNASDSSGCLQRIGRFEIERELGAGGHGIVFLALDTLLRRKVALKVPRPEAVASAEMRRRFVSEARAAAQLSHPNIVAVHDVGDLGPLCFISAEYCPGPTLAAWLLARGARLALGRAAYAEMAELVAALSDAVSHAHGHGILHRDLKPSNVLLVQIDNREVDCRVGETRSLGGYVPRLTDFGLAKLDDPGADRTHTGALLGTPAYMAPEQAEGRGRDVSVRTDVYGLGAVLYELMTGRAPFSGGTPLDTIRRLVTEDLEPPSRLAPDLPTDLEAICLKCLEKNPQGRYASVADLAADLRRFLRGEPTLARPLAWRQRVVKWSHRRPLAAALFGVLLLSTMVLALVVTTYTIRLRGALAEAQRQRAEADSERQKAEHQREVVQVAERVTRESQQETRRLMYASDIRLADEAYRSGVPSEAVELLERYLPRDGEEDLREFAWRYLWHRCHRRMVTLRGHAGAVFWSEFSHDGAQVATAGQDGVIRLWNAIDGALLRTLAGHTGDVNCLSFTADDRSLASCGADGMVRIWDTATGGEVRTIQAAGRELITVAFSPGGRWLAAAGQDHMIRIWSLPDWQLQATLDKHSDFVHSIAFAPDDATLVSCGDDGVVYMWDLKSAAPRHALPGHCGEIYSISFSPRGSQFAVAGQNGQVVLWSSADGHELRRFNAHATRATSVAFSGDGRRILTAGRDQYARIWDTSSGVLLASFEGHADRLWRAQFSPDGTTLVTASTDQTAKICKLSEPYEVLSQYAIDRGHLVFNEQGELSAVSRAGMDAQGLSMYHDEVRENWRPDYPGATTILDTIIDPTGRVALARDVSGRLLLRGDSDPWHLVAGRFSLEEYGAIALSPKGSLIAHGSRDLAILELSSWTPQSRFEFPTALAWLKFSGDGRKLVGSRWDGTTFSWDAHAPTSLRSWRAISTFRPRDGAVSFDGSRIAVANDDGHVHVFDSESVTVRYELAGNRAYKTSVVMSPDGVDCAVASANLWDLRSGRKLLSLADLGCALHALSAEELVGVLPSMEVIRWTAPYGERARKRLAANDAPVDAGSAPPPAPSASHRQRRILPLGEPPRVSSPTDVFARFIVLGSQRQLDMRPTFDDREDESGLQLGGLVMRNTQVVADIYTSNNDAQAIAALTRDADSHSKKTRQSAGYPYLFEYRLRGLTVLEPGTFERRDVPVAELGEIDLDIDRFREIHRWAKNRGFAGGFPTFNDVRDGDQELYGAVLIPKEFAEEIFVPAKVLWQDEETASKSARD